MLRIFNRRRNFDVGNLWVCWFIFFANYQISLITTERCGYNNSLCDVFSGRLHQLFVDMLNKNNLMMLFTAIVCRHVKKEQFNNVIHGNALLLTCYFTCILFL